MSLRTPPLPGSTGVGGSKAMWISWIQSAQALLQLVGWKGDSIGLHKDHQVAFNGPARIHIKYAPGRPFCKEPQMTMGIYMMKTGMMPIVGWGSDPPGRASGGSPPPGREREGAWRRPWLPLPSRGSPGR